MRCAGCGYPAEYHDQGAHCPLCACGKAPGEHLPVVEPPSPLLAEAHRALHVCPGKPRTASGNLPLLRRGKLREPEAPTPMREWSQGVCVPVIEAPAETASVPQAPPRVPARYTFSLDEIAPRARPLGASAADVGWRVDPWYWQSADGTETSALVMWRDELRAVAYWERKPGGSWRTSGAQAWRSGAFPSKITVTQLTRFLAEIC